MFPELDEERFPELDDDRFDELELEREFEAELREFELELLLELEDFCELGRLSITAPRSVSILSFSRLYPRS